MSGEELRALAEAATPGPWTWEPPSDESWPQGDQSLVPALGGTPVLCGWGYDASGIDAEEVDRAFIAAANPTAVLALLDERDALRAQVERVRALADAWEAECDPIGGCTPSRHHRRLRAALDPQ